jgi:hypothetical protein
MSGMTSQQSGIPTDVLIVSIHLIALSTRAVSFPGQRTAPAVAAAGAGRAMRRESTPYCLAGVASAILPLK